MKKIIFLLTISYWLSANSYSSAQQWNAVGSGFNGAVYCAAVYNNQLYVGGSFTVAGGIPANHIARWDGTKWDSVSSGTTGTVIYTLAVYNNELYAGGDTFTTAGGVDVGNYSIARWNDTVWKDVGGGMKDENW